MKGLLLFLLPVVCLGQSVTIPTQTVTSTAPSTKAQQVTIVTPKNGGPVTFTIPGQTLKPVTVTVQGQTVPIITPDGILLSYTFTCTIPAGSVVVINPNGAPSIPPLECKAVKK